MENKILLDRNVYLEVLDTLRNFFKSHRKEWIFKKLIKPISNLSVHPKTGVKLLDDESIFIIFIEIGMIIAFYHRRTVQGFLLDRDINNNRPVEDFKAVLIKYFTLPE